MMRINHKSDFDFVLHLSDARGQEIGWPDCDWRVAIWSVSRDRSLVASCMDGDCCNCFNDDGKIHIVADNHRLGVGRLQCELVMEIPDGRYPDGYQRVVLRRRLDVELVAGDSDCKPCVCDVTVDVPVLLRNAWELAVDNGYKGTYEEWCRLSSDLPGVVEEARQAAEEARQAASGVGGGSAGGGVGVLADSEIEDIADEIFNA